MSNASSHVRSRHSHGSGTRDTHGESAYEVGAIQGAEEVYQQASIDQVYSQQNIMPGAVGTPQIQDGALAVAKFAATIRPVIIVSALPTLPDVNYPINSYVVLDSTHRLWKNIADVWVLGVDGADIVADSITAGQIAAGAISASELSVGVRGRSNLVMNGSFEDGMSGWIPSGNANIVATSALSGLRRLDLAAVSAFDASAVTAVQFPVRSGDMVYASAWAKAVSGAAWFLAQLHFYDGAGAFITNTTILNYLTGGSTVWTQVSGSLVVPVGAVMAGINLISGSAGTTVAVDDVIVRTSDSLMTANGNVLIDVNGVTILNGALAIQDEYGKSVMTASGFSGSWVDFIQLGLYNARFLGGIPGTVPNGRTSAVPYWTFSNTSGTPTATYLSGGGVRVNYGALTDRKELVSDLVSVRPNTEYSIPTTFNTVVVAGAMAWEWKILWFKSDGVTPASVPSSSLGTLAWGSTVTGLSQDSFITMSPSDASFAKVDFGMYEITAHNAGNSMTIVSLGLKEMPPRQLYNPALLDTWVFDDVFTDTLEATHFVPPAENVVVAQATTGQATITTEVDLTSLAVTITALAGHRYRISFVTAWTGTTLGNYVQARIKEGATTLQDVRGSTALFNVARSETVQGFVYVSPSAGSHTYKITGAMAAGTGSISMVASSTQPAQILVEDLG